MKMRIFKISTEDPKDNTPMDDHKVAAVSAEAAVERVNKEIASNKWRERIVTIQLLASSDF